MGLYIENINVVLVYVCYMYTHIHVYKVYTQMQNIPRIVFFSIMGNLIVRLKALLGGCRLWCSEIRHRVIW